MNDEEFLSGVCDSLMSIHGKDSLILQHILGMANAIRRLKAENEKLLTLKARLPHTADGVVIIPPMDCWCIYGDGKIAKMPVKCIDWLCGEWLARNWNETYTDCRKASELYSTYAEAEKALKEEKP